uniref:NACHT domain-containing protein n=2 Tax=Amphimedon queenslandica TaxID=400682 RepID=A0A1X7T7L6_AMPQE
MIDVSQWRASIGLWNYCQAASSRPANGRHSYSFKAKVEAKVDSWSGHTTSGEKTSKLPAVLSFTVSLLLSLLRCIKFIFSPSTGKQFKSLYVHSIISGTAMICLQSLVLFIATICSNSDLIYYLVLLLLLLLSGDVEVNPGPMIDDQPSCLLFAKCIKPLVDWKPFALCLPGMTQSDVSIIDKAKRNAHLQKMALHKKWLQANPQASWRDVINALKQCKENELARTIEHEMEWSTGGANNDGNTSTNPTGKNSNDNMEAMTKFSTNPGHITGNLMDILRTHSHLLTDGISCNLYRITSELLAKGLIPQQAFDDVLVMGVMTDYTKAMKLMSVLQRQLESSLNPEQYLINICHILINQHHCTLTDIATSILHQLGQSIPDNVSSHTVLPSPVDDIFNNTRGQSDIAKPISAIPGDVQVYADNMRQHYKHQPIVATDWPPRIGKDFFGRLALVEKQDSNTQAESAWHLLRGQVDKTVKLTGNKEISVENVLQPTHSSLSLRVVIDGPPGIGKTTLCRKLLNMWSNGTLVHRQYDLVLYCPLRNSKIATATTLAELFEFKSSKVSKVVDWLSDRDGEGLLIIFDGWDELSEHHRQSSLAASIIYRKQLGQSSVIVTSRTYASSSLLEISNLSRHVQVIGFSEEEISIVIIQTLQKDAKLAQELIDKKREAEKNKKTFTTTQSSRDSQLAVKLINDLKVRDDAQSLCYIPLVCSMVILVYCKEGGHLPTTLTQLYENFILQTIRRHVKRHDNNPHTLGSLSSLPSQLAKPLQEMCRLAYTNLADTTMTFSSYQLQSLSEAVQEDYLGLMTTFIEYDEEMYQFLHLSIQEFLAAWWIAKHEKKTEEVFKDHFDDDHFRMCLRFVAGLTHLEHESYEQYFNKQQLDLQCKIEALFGFETYQLSYFYQNSEINFKETAHILSDDFDSIPNLLLQLLYESQNKRLCQVLAQSIKNHLLCLDRVSLALSLFDWMCLSYCISNSNTTWDQLHLGEVSNQSLSVFTAGLTNNSLQTQCKRLE